MISNSDRSGYFGASDTAYILGNTQTKTFRKWWLEKMGIPPKKFTNVAMLAGTHFEHRILDKINVVSRDRQFINEALKIRVNLDGDKDGCIYEVKTYKSDKPFKMPKKYIEQVQVQMFVSGLKTAKIVVYKLLESDYKNFFAEIDEDRIKIIDVPYDEDFINNKYLPKVKFFAECLERGVIPQ